MAPIALLRFSPALPIARLREVSLALAERLAGRPLAFTLAESRTDVDLDRGPVPLFDERHVAPGAEVRLIHTNGGFGNPRDGWGYEQRVDVVIEGLPPMHHSAQTSGPNPDRLSFEVPGADRASFARVRSALAAVGEDASADLANVCAMLPSQELRRDPAWAMDLADEALAAPGGDPTWRGRLREAREALAPSATTATRLAETPGSPVTWRAIARAADGPSPDVVAAALARLSPHDEALVATSPLSIVAAVWLEHPWLGAEPTPPAPPAVAPPVPADTGWLHEGGGVEWRWAWTWKVKLGPPDAPESWSAAGEPAPGWHRQATRRVRLEGGALVGRVEVLSTHPGAPFEERRWTFFFGEGPTDVLVALEVRVDRGQGILAAPTVLRAVGRETWVARALLAVTEAAPGPLVPGDGAPCLAP